MGSSSAAPADQETRRPLHDWLALVDQRGRTAWLVGLVLAVITSLMEIGGAAFVVAAMELATADAGSAVHVPIFGDIEELLPGADRASDLRWLAVIGSLFFLVRGVTALGQLHAMYRATFSLGVRLCERVVRALLERPYEWHLGRNSSELATTSVVVSQHFAINVYAPTQAAAAQVVLVIALTGFALAVEPVGTLAAAAVLAGALILSLGLTQRPLIRLGKVDIDETSLAQRLAGESFASVREVKVLDIAGSVRRDIGQSRRRWAKALRSRATVIAVPRILIETVAFATLLTFLALRGSNSASALGGIGAIGYAVVRMLPTINSLITNVNTARGSQATMHAIAPLLEGVESGAEEARGSAAEAVHLPLRFSGVAYRYPDGPEVLHDITLEVTPGVSVGVVGATGSGKSTLLDLMIGLLPPAAGELTVGGAPLREHTLAWWRDLGVVPQAIVLLDATLAENIALGVRSDQIDDAAMARAIDLAQLREVVEALPAGLDTPIGERGVRLSGGQRQRVAIARALYRDPKVVILDEGTSALDAETERAVIEGLRSGRPDRTLIMVAHRVSTLRDCDEILRLEKGRIAERGTHDELLAASPQFRELAAAATTDP